MTSSHADRIHRRVKSLAATVAGTLVLAAVTLLVVTPAALADGVRWQDLTLDEALAKAEEQNTIVMVDVLRRPLRPMRRDG